MTVITQNNTYEFIQNCDTRNIHVLYRGKDIFVESIEHLRIGERMTVYGYEINPDYGQINNEGLFFTTSPIIDIIL